MNEKSTAKGRSEKRNNHGDFFGGGAAGLLKLSSTSNNGFYLEKKSSTGKRNNSRNSNKGHHSKNIEDNVYADNPETGRKRKGVAGSKTKTNFKMFRISKKLKI